MGRTSTLLWTSTTSLLLLLGAGTIVGCSSIFPDPLSPIKMLEQLTFGDHADAPRLADQLHTELLTARSSLLDFVNLQDSASRLQGLRHLQNAQARSEKLAALVEGRPDLLPLRPYALQFKGDLASYQSSLASLLRLSDSGIQSGDLYREQVRQWTRRGSALASDADTLQVLAYTSSPEHTGTRGPGISHPGIAYPGRLDDHSSLETVEMLPDLVAISLAALVLALIMLLAGRVIRREHKRSSLRQMREVPASQADLTTMVSVAPAPPGETLSAVPHFGAMRDLLGQIVGPDFDAMDAQTQRKQAIAAAASCILTLMEAA